MDVKLIQTELENDVDLRYGEIVIPAEIHVASNTECNLWWSSIANVVEGDKSVYFETVCDIGRNCERGFLIGVKEVLTAGEYPLRVVCRDARTREVLSDKTTTIKVVDNAANNTTKNILMIGDSRTWQSFGGTNGTTTFSNFSKADGKTISTELYHLTSENPGTKLNMIGNFVSPFDPKIKNLANSGGTYAWAMRKIEDAGGVKAFCEANGMASGENLDIVTIMYGINDFDHWNHHVIDQYSYMKNKIDSIIVDAKTLVDAILTSYPDCKVIVVLESTTCANQDGYGFWGGVQTIRDSYCEVEFAQKYLRKKVIENFDQGAYRDNVVLSSAGLWCDRLYGFPYLIEPVSRRSAVTKEVFQECVHPFDDGYRQIADGIFSTIKSLE